MRLRLGTRGSALARWQAEWVNSRLTELGIDVELVPIATSGDLHQQKTITAVGAFGVFTKELQIALLDNRIDLAVHSLKDLPTEQVSGLCLTAVPERGSVADVLISRYDSLDDLPDGAVVGTGSLRRKAQILNVRPDIRIKDIRGNVDTRLGKLDNGEYDAIVLAEAGLQRLGLEERIAQVLPNSIMMPAVGQGALGLETRCDDHKTRAVLESITHRQTFDAVLAERAMLLELDSGCLAPIAAWAKIEGQRLKLSGRVLSAKGDKMVEATWDGQFDDAELIGQKVADSLLEQGADELIANARKDA